MNNISYNAVLSSIATVFTNPATSVNIFFKLMISKIWYPLFYTHMFQSWKKTSVSMHQSEQNQLSGYVQVLLKPYKYQTHL